MKVLRIITALATLGLLVGLSARPMSNRAMKRLFEKKAHPARAILVKPFDIVHDEMRGIGGVKDRVVPVHTYKGRYGCYIGCRSRFNGKYVRFERIKGKYYLGLCLMPGTKLLNTSHFEETNHFRANRMVTAWCRANVAYCKRDRCAGDAATVHAVLSN